MRRLLRALILGGLALASTQCARLAGLGEGDGLAPSSGVASTDGTKTDPHVSIEPPTLDFGSGACAAEIMAAQVLNIHNDNDTPIDYAAQVPMGSGVRIDGPPLAGSIPAKSSVGLQIHVTPLLADVNGAEIIVTAGGAVQTVHVAVKGNGPTMELAPGTIAFGEVRKEDGSLPVTVQVTNHGNAELDVTSFTSTEKAFIVGTLAAVPVGATVPLTVKLGIAAADDPMLLTANITPDASGICGAPPVLKVSGQRVTSDITVGAADWGDQACASTPGAKTIDIQNYSNEALGYTLQPAANSAFVITDNGPNPMLAGAESGPTKSSLTITPKMLPTTAPLNDIKENLGLTFNGSKLVVNQIRTTTLHVRPHGVIIQITPSTMAFNGSGSKGFTVTNAGNDDVYIQWTIAYSPPNPWNVNNVPFFLAGGQAVSSGSVSYAKTNGSVSGTVNVQQPPFIPGEPPQCSPFGSIGVTGM